MNRPAANATRAPKNFDPASVLFSCVFSQLIQINRGKLLGLKH